MKKICYAPHKFESYGEEEIKGVEEPLRSGWLGGQGPKSVEFEEKIAKRFGKKFGVFVNSGSSACLLAIAALNLPKGCKIITPSCTFSTTLAPILQLGYKPVFVDVGLDDYVANIDQVVAAITPNVKAISLLTLNLNCVPKLNANDHASSKSVFVIDAQESPTIGFTSHSIFSETGKENNGPTNKPP